MTYPIIADPSREIAVEMGMLSQDLKDAKVPMLAPMFVCWVRFRA